MAEPTFRTARMRVWEVVGVPSPKARHIEHRMFIATLDDGKTDWPGVVASCSIVDVDWATFVDWLEVVEPLRRKGLGMELLQAIDARYGELKTSGASRAGNRLSARFQAWQRKAVARA